MDAVVSNMSAPVAAPSGEQVLQNNQAGVAQIHYFDNRNFEETQKVLIEFCGFVIAEASKPNEPLTQAKLGTMLHVYITNCLRKGPPVEERAPVGATCQHLYTKGDKSGQLCGKAANHVGLEGKAKCSSHKTSKPSKSDTTPGAGGPVPSSGASGQTFSYSANQGKGKIAPQSLTSIQAAIAEQTAPAKLELTQDAAGRIYNPATNIVFEQRPEGWIAIGVLDSDRVVKLTVMEAHVCLGNHWKWDPACVEDEAAKTMAHPLMIGADHPLVNNQAVLISRKVESVIANNAL